MTYIVKSVTNNQYTVKVVNQNGSLLQAPTTVPTVTTSAISDTSKYSTTIDMLANDATTYANSVTYVNSKSFVNTSQLSSNLTSYQTTAGLSANVATLTANNTNYFGNLSLSTIQSQITGNAETAYSNAVAYVDSKSFVNTSQLSSDLANYQTTAGLSANVAILTANNSLYLGGLAAASYVNTSQLSSNLTSYQTTAGLSANVATLTANNALYFNGLAAASYVNTSQLSSNLANYQTTAGLSANVATLTANNTSFVGLISAANVVSNSQLQSNLANYALLTGAAFSGQVNTTTLNTSGNVSIGGNLSITGSFTVGGNVTVIGANNLSIADNMIYLNANATNINPDIGIAANYNDGTYHHTGIFRDHASGTWKVFDNYLPEPDASIYIDQTNSTFHVANFQANIFYVGNNSVYATVNTTNYTGTSNNASYLGTVPATSYINTSGNYTVAGNLNFTGTNTNFLTVYVGSNALINTSTFFVGNTTVNTNITSGQVSLSGITVNSTIYQGTANNANNLNGQLGSYYTNATNITTGTLPYAQLGSAVVNTSGNYTVAGNLNFTGTNNYFSALYIGANSLINTSTHFVGNATVNTSVTAGQVSISGVTVNSTIYQGTANNANNLNGQSASYYTNATNISTGTLPDARLSSAVVNTSGNFTVAGNLNFTGTNNYFSALYVGANSLVNATTYFVGNSTVNTNITGGQISISGVTVNSTIYQGTANNANNLGGQLGSYYTNATNITTGTLPYAQLGTAVVNTSSNFTVAGNLNFTGTNNYFSALYVGANSLINATTHFVGNSTVNTNITAGQISISGVTVNSTIYQGTALTANNASYLGTVAASSYVNTSGNYTVAGNLNFTGTNNYFNALYVGANSLVNATTHFVGNSTVNTSITGGQISLSGVTINSSSYGGSANNASYLGTVAASSYVNTSGAYTITGVHTHSANVVLNSGLSANGSYGTAGQLLTSNGTVAYWSTVTSGGVDTSAQYTWTNTQTYSANIIINNNKDLNFKTLSGAVASFVQQNDDNFVFYTTNTSGGVRAVFNVFANTDTPNQNSALRFNCPIDIGTQSLFANGSVGGSGQLLTSNGSATYWSSPGAAGVNVAAQYTWTNTQIFSNTITFSQVINGTANNANYLNGQLASYYTNATNITTGTLPYAQLGTAVVNTSGNFTVAGNLNFTGTNNYFSALYTGANVIINTSTLFVGNTSINTSITAGQISLSGVTVNSTIYQGTANNANNLGGQLGSYYTNATNITTGTLPDARLSSAVVNTSGNFTVAGNLNFTGTNNYFTSIYVGANSLVNATTHFVGNSTVNTNITSGQISLSGVTVNSTIYQGTANNANNLNGQLGSYYTNATNITTGTLPYAQLGTAVVNTSGSFTLAGDFTLSANLSSTGWINIEGYTETKAAPTISSGALTLDLAAASVFDVSLNNTVTSFTISNTPAIANKTTGFVLIFTADGTARTVAWPSSVKWANNSPPTITSTNTKKDVYVFFTTDNGTSYNGFISGQNI